MIHSSGQTSRGFTSSCLENRGNVLTFQHAHGRFNYRTVAVVVHEQRVLLHRCEHDAFWALPGGRVEFGEPAATALLRELQEEMGVVGQVERLLWIVENFYEYEEYSCHELALYFLVSFPHNAELYTQDAPFAGQEDDLQLIFQWFPVDQLEQLELYPTFLRQRLRALPSTAEHVVHCDP